MVTASTDVPKNKLMYLLTSMAVAPLTLWTCLLNLCLTLLLRTVPHGYKEDVCNFQKSVYTVLQCSCNYKDSPVIMPGLVGSYRIQNPVLSETIEDPAAPVTLVSDASRNTAQSASCKYSALLTIWPEIPASLRTLPQNKTRGSCSVDDAWEPCSDTHKYSCSELLDLIGLIHLGFHEGT